MSNKIVRLNYESLRNEAHVEYYEVVSRLIERFRLSLLGGEEYYEAYLIAYADEVSILDMIRKSEFTQQMRDQDKVRDRAFRGFVDAVKSAQNHHEEDLQKHAKRLDLVLKNYKNIAQRPLDQQTAAVDDFIREIRDNYQGDIDLLRLQDWIYKLDRENERFREIVANRDSESSQRPSLRMPAARKKVDKCFRDILTYIEAIIFSTKSDQYDEFIKELNAVSLRYKKK